MLTDMFPQHMHGPNHWDHNLLNINQINSQWLLISLNPHLFSMPLGCPLNSLAADHLQTRPRSPSASATSLHRLCTCRTPSALPSPRQSCEARCHARCLRRAGRLGLLSKWQPKPVHFMHACMQASWCAWGIVFFVRQQQKSSCDSCPHRGTGSPGAAQCHQGWPGHGAVLAGGLHG